MRTLALLALLAWTTPAQASSTLELAEKPQAYVEDGVCHIRGGAWDRGPVRHARVALVAQGERRIHEARTDNTGQYEIAIPVEGRTSFVAQVPGETAGARPRYADRRSRWITPTVVCRSPVVTIRDIQRVR